MSTMSSRARRISKVAGALLLAAAAGCARPNQLTSTWRDPAIEPGALRRLMVVAVGRTSRERRLYEDAVVTALRARGIDALPSYPEVGDERVDSARVDTAMHRMGCDGIVVSRVVDRQTVQRYYPPAAAGYGLGHGYYGLPRAYHGGWWPYYSLGYAYAASPGYTVSNQRVSVESNLYQQRDGRLVWSGLSREWLSQGDPPGAEIAPMARQLAAELARSAVVVSSAPPRAGSAAPHRH